MPMYDYRCNKCQHANTEYLKMENAEQRLLCPKCYVYAYQKQVSQVHTDLKEYHTPIEMFSIAMEDQSEIRAFKQRCPEIDVSDDPADELYGVPVARTRKGKMQALQAAGFREKN